MTTGFEADDAASVRLAARAKRPACGLKQRAGIREEVADAEPAVAAWLRRIGLRTG
ncbi:hypothetical protein [Virgisporangium aurantiacum]|uniref:Uncharacterized protein n=1 Tax=Virgisporangium aurantiacum TaxID=175570 RepID=A0A8J3ZJT4_9ACTN|nr:hypothetical protein [Virgisporangium aurantiacum]GIJ62826.1 hypothetical protein Vau01_103420 [Virgisporangium aurantiacum]